LHFRRRPSQAWPRRQPQSARRQCHRSELVQHLIAGKALGLLYELVPNAALIAVLTNPKLPESARTPVDAQEAARALGRQLLVSALFGKLLTHWALRATLNMSEICAATPAAIRRAA